MDQQQPCIGEASGCARYVLDVLDFIQPLNPPPQFGMKSLNATDYFITSGDAVQKTRYLAKVIWSYAGIARKQLREKEETI